MPMPDRHSCRLLVATAIGVLAAVAACSKKESAPIKPAHPEVATSIVSGGTASQPTPAITTWDDSLGNVLAIMSTERGAPVFFSRDTLGAVPHVLTLFSHDTLPQFATLLSGAAVRECARERIGTVSTPDRPGVPVWSFALDTGLAKPIGIDGLDDLLPRDSSAMIVRLRKLAGTIPEDSISATFRGLPVVVREAWRVMTPEGTPVWITLSTRALGTESNPRLELLTMIAEPDGTTRDALRIAWSRRESGPEDKVVGADLLAALMLRGSRMALAMSRSGDHGDEIEIIDRPTPGHWRLRWSSSALGCEMP
jgi:hypothetical protein